MSKTITFLRVAMDSITINYSNGDFVTATVPASVIERALLNVIELQQAVERAAEPTGNEEEAALAIAQAASETSSEVTAEDPNEVKRGKQVVIVSGRKYPIGTAGECFWVGENRYGWGCGIKLADGSKIFTALRNVRVSEQLQLGA